MNEDTLIKTMALPHGRLWEWYADANIIVLSPCLDEQGRESALNELQAQWRRSGLRVVRDGPIGAVPDDATHPFSLPNPPLRAAEV